MEALSPEDSDALDRINSAQHGIELRPRHHACELPERPKFVRFSFI